MGQAAERKAHQQKHFSILLVWVLLDEMMEKLSATANAICTDQLLSSLNS